MKRFALAVLFFISLNAHAVWKDQYDELLDWIDVHYSDQFYPSTKSTYVGSGFIYRCWRGVNTCIGIKEDTEDMYIYANGEFTNIGNYIQYYNRAISEKAEVERANAAETEAAENAEAAAEAAIAALESTFRYQLQIVGDESFTTHVNKALDLLKRKDLNAYIVVRNTIGRIKQDAWCNMDVWEEPPTFRICPSVVYNAPEYLASAIAHDSWHSKLYLDYKDTHPGQHVPDSIYSGEAIEMECTRYQIEVAKNVGAVYTIIEFLESLLDGHDQWWLTGVQ